ncbi:MAG: CHAP domain-containing protein [Saprospiraceae bacterium]|nr:CHAP domain-containing protein [Saprospiraceae bacterium]
MKISLYIKYVTLTVSLFFGSSFFAPKIGDVIDSVNGVKVYYNGSHFAKSYGRNLAPDGYNLGLKYQCVEFVKRYYYQVYGHKMPNAQGNARDFFDKKLEDRAYNVNRGLMQYRNVREYAPKAGDLLVYDSYPGNPYGHVAIIAEVGPEHVVIVQQNIGTITRERLKLVKFMQYYTIADYDILGWLRRE